MSEKDANDNAYSFENGNDSEAAQALPEEAEQAPESLDAMVDGKIKKKESESVDLDSYLPPYDSQSKKEENPFSFKKFLNQESSTQKNKGARKKIFTSPKNSSSSDNTDLMNHRASRVPGDINSRISTSDMSSVLPDFVQDHLVIEQCYLSGSPPNIDINNLNLQNLPDLNLEHRNVHFMLSDDRKSNHPSNSSDNLSPNLPDFALGASNFQPGTQNIPNSKRLPDFTLHARTDANEDVSRSDINNANNSSQSYRQRAQISASPSVPLDLPSFDESNQNLTIPFDLTAPTEENTSSCRGRPSNETVSKSLPDFLSDGPIKKEINENLQNIRGIMGSTQNGLPSDVSSSRAEDRLLREIDSLRCQLAEKNRRLERMEKELELLHSADQRETASLEYALQEVENNLKQTAKRALSAEKTVLRLKQENKSLKTEISSLRSENVALRLGTCDPQTSSSSNEVKQQKIARELKAAANQAESSLRSLLMGVDNLRALAAGMENSYRFQDADIGLEDFPNEDSASGPAP